MATGGGPGSHDLRFQTDSLYADLAKDPEKHNVFQALRVIEAHFSDAPRLGESRRAREDRVRLGQEAELAFPPSTIARFQPGGGREPARLTNRFFGFFGPQGPLPLHLTEYARDRQRNHRDGTFVAFANMLTHRLMSLLYRAWSAGQPAPSFDRGTDPFEQKVAALSGYAGRALRARDPMPDLARRHFSAHLAMGPKSPEALVSMLTGFFGVPVSVQQFVGSWLELEPDDTWQLGRVAGLGQSTSIGTKVWSRTSKFRLRIGPLTLADYERLLPGGESLDRLQAIVRSYVGDVLDWDVNLVLKGAEVPRASLGGTTRLGHTSWVKSRDDNEDERPDAGDLFLYPALARP